MDENTLPVSDEGMFAIIAAAGVAIAVVGLIVYVVTALGLMKVFEKAGKPGWAAFVPVYNIVVILEIVGRPMWWLALFLTAFIPIVGAFICIGISIVINIDLAKSFGKGTGFGVAMGLFTFIMYPLLGFGDAQYVGPSAAKAEIVS